ncbi:MAG: hypothetical protein OXE98_00975 [Hyphomicrobiales bacterium]|nr:hypothetical protein [Hyphomicrobiales bacterium]
MPKEKHNPTDNELEETFELTQKEYDAIEGNSVQEKLANFVRMIMPGAVEPAGHFEDFDNDYRNER